MLPLRISLKMMIISSITKLSLLYLVHLTVLQLKRFVFPTTTNVLVICRGPPKISVLTVSIIMDIRLCACWAVCLFSEFFWILVFSVIDLVIALTSLCSGSHFSQLVFNIFSLLFHSNVLPYMTSLTVSYACGTIGCWVRAVAWERFYDSRVRVSLLIVAKKPSL